jgi:hypothetical protein
MYRVISAVVAACVLFCATNASAQYRSTRKEHKGPRAIAVIEFPQAPKDAKTQVKYAPRLIPAIILNNGKYFDASAYMATPVPWAIQPGTVYEAREAGESKGLFNIRGASADANKNWIATGVWDSAEAIEARAEAKHKQEEAKKEREAALKEQAKDTGPPKLTRNGPDKTKQAPKPVPPPPPPTTDDDPDRPKMRRGSSDESATAAAKPEAPEARDPDAPELRRGKPAKDSPLVTAPPKPAPKQTPLALSNNKLLAAISDATPDDDRSFLFLWKPEEQKRLTKLMSDLAEAELASGQEGDSNVQGTKGRAAKKITLENVQVRAFDPATNNEAVLILTASAPVLRKDAAGQNATFNRYVSLVAHVDLDNLPHKLFSSVTDDDHLDTVGILQLVDAVDSDGDGRAEFLFRRIGKDSQRFELYRSYGSQLLKLF